MRGRAELIAELRREGIRDERVLAALAVVPRECFVPEEDRHLAYADVALGRPSRSPTSSP
jgi:protein-L-isoaspartate(D-aspartate) O-methyltransferase